MRLTLADWSIVALYFLFNVAVGLYYKRRAGRDTAEFFLSGRNVPWWLAGTSMVATTFAADTPLAVTGLVARNGVAGNWLWWNLLASGMLTVFFYARLWRRAGVMTDIEFSEIRYAGRPAAFLRGFRALYLGVLINCIILGWVNLAMVKILRLLFGVGKLEALAMVLGLIALTSAISTLSGLWGVLVTDLFQFVIKMGMVIVLAVVAVHAVGGIDAMTARLALLPGYVRVMIDYLPSSLRGLMVAAFAAAYMSTIATQLNWGASYLVNDCYRRFLRRDATERHYVRASQVATVLLTVVSAIATFYMGSIAGAWKLLIVTGAGTGTVLLLRWYWWRINAWSEVSAMISAFVVSVLMQTVAGLDSDRPVDFAWIMIATVAVTTIVWLAVTFLTAPESRDTLVAFYRRTRPSRFGWEPVAAWAPEVRASTDGLANLLDWIAGCVLIYGVLFGVGKLLLHDTLPGVLLVGLGCIAGAVIYRDLSRRGWRAVVE